MYRSGSLTAAPRELARHKLGLEGVQEVRWDNRSTERAEDYNFFYGKGSKNYNRNRIFCTPEQSISS
jgi:hypothetical protein